MKVRTPGALAGTTTRRGGILAGCLVVLGVVLLLVIAGIIFVAMNWKTWTANLAHDAAEAFVAELNLPESEQGEIMVEFERLTEGFKTGDVTGSQLQSLIEQLSTSPLVPVTISQGAKAQYIDRSELTDEEKAAGELALSRLSRGVFEEMITPEQMKEALSPISTNAFDGSGINIDTGEFRMTLKNPENVTDEELREMIENVTALADEEEVPNEMYSIDFSDEFRKIIDEALGEGDGHADHDHDHDHDDGAHTDDEPEADPSGDEGDDEGP